MRISQKTTALIGSGVTVAAGIAASLALPAAPAQAQSAHGYPVCVYTSQLAYEKRDKNERACFRLGAHTDLTNRKYNNIANRPVQYIDVKDGYFVDLYAQPNWAGDAFTVEEDTPADIARGVLQSIRVYKRGPGRVKGYPLCIYGGYLGYKNKWEWNRACFQFGEYDTLSLPQFKQFNDKAEYVDLRPGYKVVLFEHVGFKGARAVQSKDGKMSDTMRKEVSSLRIEEINPTPPPPRAAPPPPPPNPTPAPPPAPPALPPPGYDPPPAPAPDPGPGIDSGYGKVLSELDLLRRAAEMQGRRDDADTYRQLIDIVRQSD